MSSGPNSDCAGNGHEHLAEQWFRGSSLQRVVHVEGRHDLLGFV